MELSEYKRITEEWTKHLSGFKNINFEKLINLAKENRRVRNSLLFFVYTHNEYTEQFEERAKKDSLLNYFKNEFIKALERLKRGNEECRAFAKNIYNKYFSNIKVEIDVNKYDISAEMSKLFGTMINCYRLEDNPQKQAYREKVLRTVDYNNLIG